MCQLCLTAPKGAMSAREMDLRIEGYRTQDLGSEFGASFAGEFRWVNVRTGEGGDHVGSESAAWDAAEEHSNKIRID